MAHVSSSSFRDLEEFLDSVCASDVPVTVTRTDKKSVVVLSEDEYSSLMETLYLLRSPANARDLRESVADLDAGRGLERNLLS
ncbi:type II toxin-antitoxin system Phd/YefM family antitoxin [Salinarimonas ramus]|uniref:Antitoxin n=1 Tax=Salinarimonas ramus TaxID=690164 RepID=A0A917QFY9_9HYPH|nr:type II toxin-antitoxin system Phd/YefM family antitoxin [Salinarimonas ramus]GGK48542.1 antitoxin [Salinarimonas ramus]